MPVEGEDREAIQWPDASLQNTHETLARQTNRRGSRPSCSVWQGLSLTPQSMPVRARPRGMDTTATAHSVVSSVVRIPPTASPI
jgi:hypothetical protein